MKTFLTFAAVVMLGVSLALVIGCGKAAEQKSDSAIAATSDSAATVPVSQTKERFTLQDLDGRQRSWSEFIGKPFLVNFWATWCPPCRMEIPTLKKLYEEYHPQGLEIVAISMDTKTSAVKPFADQMQLPWVVLYTDEKVPDEMKLGRGIPMTVFFDAQGVEVGRVTGAMPEAYFREQIGKLFPAAKPQT
jgi:thiol-disulfide isomerase/thioredoxin